MTKSEMKARSLGSKKGYTLITSMVLLIAMSMMGIFAVKLAVQQTKIAKNYENSIIAMTWAEAGIEAARQKIVSSVNPAIPNHECTNETNEHFYPTAPTEEELNAEKGSLMSIPRRAKYCIELITTSVEGQAGQRGSAQDGGKVIRTYFYKVDSYVTRQSTTTDEEVTIRHIQTIEQQSRYSI